VADFQHPHGAAINWPEVAAAGYKFAFIKATEGDYYDNPYAAGDLAQAKAAGLSVAEYHFAVPNVSGGASQAEYAVRNSGYTTNGHTLPLTLDIEYNPYGAECYGLSHAAMVSWISAFTAEARHLTGQRPVIYTTADWWKSCTGGSTAFGADPLWVAGYGVDSPPLPAGWGNWTFWQFTSKGSVPGITGHVDISYFLRSATLPVARTQPASPSRSATAVPSRSAPAPTRSAPSSPPPSSSSPSPSPSSVSPSPSPSSPSPSTSPSSPG
jgi:GH25 family lysozyme M1 (1,4-beta-N-acetylmuramidase)